MTNEDHKKDLRLTFSFDRYSYRKLKKLAAQKSLSLSATVRVLINESGI